MTKTDVLRAKVEVARAERAVITAENNVQLTATVFAHAVGVRGTVPAVEPPPLFKKDVGVEVKQTLLAAETLAATLDTLKKEVALAQENYNITSRQYRVGLATSLDVNTALNAFRTVRQNSGRTEEQRSR